MRCCQTYHGDRGGPGLSKVCAMEPVGPASRLARLRTTPHFVENVAETVILENCEARPERPKLGEKGD